MKKGRISTIRLCLQSTCVIAMLLCLSGNRLEASSTPVPTTSNQNNEGAARPNDESFLVDKIELEILIPKMEPVRIVTRPSKKIRISLPMANNSDEVVTFGYLFHPEKWGEPAKARSDILSMPVKDLTFTMVPFCLESMLLPSEPPPGESQVCRPRPKHGNLSDSVRVLGNMQVHHIGFDAAVVDPANQIQFTIKKYIRGGENPEHVPLSSGSNCCVEIGTAEVCACRVGSSINACGCS